MAAKKVPLGLAVALLIVSFAGCSSAPKAPNEEGRPVKTMVVTAGDQPFVRSFPGRVEASRMVDLAFQVPGVLASVPVKEGERVAKGALIAQLRQEEFQARQRAVQGQLDAARSQLRASESRLANAKTESESFARLVDSSAVSRSDYDQAQTVYRVAQDDQKAQEASVRGLEGRLTEASLQLSDSTLRAPYAGVIAQRLVDEGQNIVPNSPVIRFQNADELDVVVDVPEGFMTVDSHGATIQQSIVEFSTVPGRQFPAQFKEVAQVADARTQVFPARFTMKPPAGVSILPGMTANVIVTSRGAPRPSSRMLVPVSAISKQDTGEQVVWVMAADHTVHRKAVKIGTPTGESIEVVEGLQPGERIVVAGASFLRDGMKVRDLGDALGGSQQ